jgi:acylphosphatase
MLIKWFVLL